MTEGHDNGDMDIDDWLKAVTSNGPKVEQTHPMKATRLPEPSRENKSSIRPADIQKTEMDVDNNNLDEEEIGSNRMGLIIVGVIFIIIGLIFSSIPEYEYQPYERTTPKVDKFYLSEEDYVDTKNHTVYASQANQELNRLDSQWNMWGVGYDEHVDAEAFWINTTTWMRKVWFAFILIGLIIPLWAKAEILIRK